MLILSKQKDYYDGVVGTTGIDKTVVYKRTEEEFSNKKQYPSEIVKISNFDQSRYRKIGINSFRLKSDKYDGYAAFIVGFCGKLYVGWKLYRKKEVHFYEKIYVDYTYDPEIIKKHIETKIDKNFFLNDLLENISNYNAVDIFRKYKTPVFIYNFNLRNIKFYRGGIYDSFLINPKLSDFKFYMVFDAYSAFQEIEMFISGVLGTGEKEITEVEDKYKIPQHGFDKWSFRREPTKKK